MNRRSAMRKSKRFFTLVEMIVAMAVMIFVALIIATASMTFYKHGREPCVSATA